MPIDPFEPLGLEPSDSLKATIAGDIKAEFAPDWYTTMACGEEGNWCGGGPA